MARETDDQKTARERAEKAAKRAAEKAANFAKLAPKRVDNVVKAMRSLGKLAGPNYTATPEQVEQINAALDTAFKDMKAAFGGGTVATGGFTFTEPGPDAPQE